MHVSRFFIESNVVIGSLHANTLKHTFDESQGRIIIHFEGGSKGKGVKKRKQNKNRMIRYSLDTFLYGIYKIARK